MDTFQIRSYGIGELARCYAPNITAGAARRKLMYWISLQPALVDALHASGFSQKAQLYARSGPPDRRGAGRALKVNKNNHYTKT